MTGVIYSAGYQRLDLDAFCAFVQRGGLLVVDVRLKPVSRNFRWNQKALVGRLGARYEWLEDLGNLNYKGPGPIVLKDAEAGLTRLRWRAEEGPVLLLCVCPTPATCHRTVITDRLAAEGFEIRHVDANALAGGTRESQMLLDGG